jgi:outer membrane protein OmpA-like peptidoglycan-associated protein
MKSVSAVLAILAFISCAAAIDSADQETDQKAFVTCPIMRDTKTVPCWLVKYRGETYYLGIQIDQAAPFQPPELEHRVLVEGSVKDGSRICGGLVLSPVRISVLPEIDPSCTEILPAVDKYTVPFAPRGPGPNQPGNSVISGPTPAEFKPPFQKKEFVVYFDFDAERAGRMTRVITEAMQYAKEARAKRVEVTGYRASVQLSDGTTLTEYPWIAEHRAAIMAETLKEIGVPASAINVKWNPEAILGSGAKAIDKRRTTIVVAPN